jgi:carbonic anhydrase
VLVVLGHKKCGAVAAAASGEKMPTANLDAIVSKIFPVVERFKGCAQGDQLIGLSVEGNVQQSARDIVENSPILQQELLERKFTAITAVYRLRTGEVYRLS